MPKYTVLDKDTIKKEIKLYLSVAKRVDVSQGCLIELVNAILHKLKSGCQWNQLPVGHLFSDVVLSWNAVYHHFRKWCRLGE
ncbi:MAG: transposase [Muribaculaceae bacterium]|nr:transposase [Muribaculaceae bacterium]